MFRISLGKLLSVCLESWVLGEGLSKPLLRVADVRIGEVVGVEATDPEVSQGELVANQPLAFLEELGGQQVKVLGTSLVALVLMLLLVHEGWVVDLG